MKFQVFSDPEKYRFNCLKNTGGDFVFFSAMVSDQQVLCKFEDNGSFEVIPSTQYLADSALCEKEINGRKNKWFNNVFGSGAEHRGRYYPVRLNLKKGSLWMQDGRAFHRGTPNVSDHTRDELCMSFNRPWFNSHWQQEEMKTDFPQDLWDSLSDHARHVLRWQWIKES